MQEELLLCYLVSYRLYALVNKLQQGVMEREKAMVSLHSAWYLL